MSPVVIGSLSFYSIAGILTTSKQQHISEKHREKVMCLCSKLLDQSSWKQELHNIQVPIFDIIVIVKIGNSYIAPHKCTLQLLRRCHATEVWLCSLHISRRLSPHTCACSVYSHIATHSSGLLFNGLHPCNPCSYMYYYLFTDPKGMGGWVGLVGWPVAHTFSTKWSRVNHRLGVGKFAR